MTDPITIPTNVLSAYDESWEEVNDYLREIGELGENEIVQKYDLTIDAEDAVTITDMETTEVPE